MRSGFSPPGIMPTLVAIKTRSRAAFLQPRAHHAFGLAALVPRNPRRIDVGGIDHPAVMLDEAVENSETRGPVGRHAKDVAAENEGPDRQAALAQRTFSHRETPFSRSEEHTSELQSLMRTSYAVF